MGHTWYIQFVLNQLFSMSKPDYSEADVNYIISEILQEENATYKTYCEIISKGQLRLLRAIAKEKKVYEPYEAGFMRKYNLTAPSSVKTALSALIDKTLLLKTEDNSYHVYDRFFQFG